MVLPAEIHRLLVFRRPLFEDGGYEVFSEDRRYQADVSVPIVTGLEWTLTFKSSSGLTLVPMRVACFSFELLDEQGRLTGSVKEARFSVSGKWVVEDGTGITLGFLRFKHLINMSFSAPDGRELAVARPYRDKKQKLPLVLKQAQIHLMHCYSLERILPLPLDERLLIGFVGLLVVRERSSFAG